MSEFKLNDEGDIDLTGGEATVDETPETEIQSEPTEDVIEVNEPEQGEPAPETPTEVEDKSSLTPQQDPVPSEPQPATELEINDDAVTKYLSEKLGKEVTLESLLKGPEPVENPLDSDPQLKEIYEWRKRTGRPLTDWAKYQKDYTTMSDIDVVRENLQYQYPEFTDEDIQMELSKYLPNADDLDAEKNRKNFELKKLAIDSRRQLNTLKSEFDTPVQGQEPAISPEVKSKLEFVDNYQKQLEESKKAKELYDSGVVSSITATNSIPLKLSEDMSIDFNIPQESKKGLQEYMKMNHWFNEDGTYNTDKVVQDSFWMQNKEAIIKLAFEQGVSKGLADDDKETRNITLDGARQTIDKNQGADQIIVEGAENFTGPRGAKIRFGK